ncbi:MAG: type II secretion system protein GspE [Rhodocyclaceae bacterium]|nr:MAG: type II secretion system protein GspE [Rhodocyclaceae bacterium]
MGSIEKTTLPYAFARTHGIVLTAVSDEQGEAILREGARPELLGEVRRHLGVPIRFARIVPPGEFDALLAETYAATESPAAEMADDLGQDIDLTRLMHEMPMVEDLLESQDDAPIIRLINVLFTQAVHERVSDIHVEPFEQVSVVRFRRDGVLGEVARPHRALHAAMASRIKIMASLDIAERRLPQDGRIALKLGGRSVDVRVSTVPTAHGERLVLRLLEKDATRQRLDALGMAARTQERFGGLLNHAHGIVLVTGPTGSGKTTTLYAALQSLDRGTRNVVTVEDPVEYDLPGVGQIAVNPRIDLTFARALRAVLRQDPDVIMIGEIRDLETAQIAVQASLTGHLVLATLHTNDSASAVTRLVDLGVEGFLLAAALRGVLAQRLVRCLCLHCRKPAPSGPVEQALLGADCPSQLWTAVGCPRCNMTGYAGRTGIYELLSFDEGLARAVHDGAAEASLRALGEAGGCVSLKKDGLRLLETGVTSADELLRVMSD